MHAPKPPLHYPQSPYKESVIPRTSIRLGAGGGGPRLNVVMPHFLTRWAFGGVVSALQVAEPLTAHYPEIRFLSLSPLDEPEEMFDFSAHVRDAGERRIHAEGVFGEEPLECRPEDVFFCTYWMSVAVWEEHARAMRRAGAEPSMFYYFIQDFEPGFYPFGYRYAMSLASYGHHAHTRAIFNSRSLEEWFDPAVYPFASRHVVDPSLNPFLLKRLERMGRRLEGKATDKTTILVYGRPEQPRNCFVPILEGLDLFFNSLPGDRRGQFQVVSAGQEHEDLILSSGVPVKSLGKLSMERYAAFLEFSHIGISFMVSPHPSYPPLEMAAFGLYTITNGFGPKDLSGQHPNLHCLPAPDPVLLAGELARAAAWAEKRGRLPQKAVLPKILSPLSWEENVRALDIPAIFPA